MSKTPMTAITLNYLIFNVLQNRSFYLAKRAVLQAKTGHIAVRNRSFQNAKRHTRKIKAAEAVF